MKSKCTQTGIISALLVVIWLLMSPVFVFSGSIPVMGLEVDNEGAAAWNTDGTGAEPANTGHATDWTVCSDYAYYYIASKDYVIAGSPGAFEGNGVIDGFPNFTAALQNNGFSLDQLTVKFGLMSLGNDIEGVDWNYDANTHIETRQYTGGTYTIRLNGEDMVGGDMPAFTVIVHYNDPNDCFDDEITGLTDFSMPADLSQNSSAGVQAVAAAFLSDLNEDGIRFSFSSMQPAGQWEFSEGGRHGAYFEVQSGTIEANEPEEVDLALNINITPDYIAYLQAKEAEYLQRLLSPENDDSTMEAYMGLTLINLAWNYIDVDSTGEMVDTLFYNLFSVLGNMLFEFGSDLYEILGEVYAPHDLVFNLISYIEAGNISLFQATMDSLQEELDAASAELSDSLGSITSRLLTNFGDASEYFNALMDSTADFTFRFTIEGSELEDSLFVVTREFLDDLETTADQLNESLTAIDDGMTALDSIFQTPGGDISPAIADIRYGLGEFDTFLDMASDLTTTQPLSPLEIDTTVFDSMSMIIEEIDTLLGGKTYPFGPEDDKRDFVPLAVLEAIPDGLVNAFLPFYWESTDPYTYTFEGIFPQGLPGEVVDMFLDDLIANTFSSREAIDIEVELKRVHYQWMLSDYPPPLGDGDPSNNGDAHFGLALLTAYSTFRDLGDDLFQIYRYLSSGRLDSLAYNYNGSILDMSDELDEIQAHLDAVLEDDYYTIFIILIKTAEDEYPDFIVDEGSEFHPQPAINEDQIAMMAEALRSFRENLNNLQMAVETVWDTLNAMMDMNLDPSALDFSDIQSDSDFILILESANPNFLTLTPYGVEKFHEMGDAIESSTYEMAQTVDYLYFLLDTLSLYQDSLGVDFSNMLDFLGMSDFILWEVYNDFAYPDSTIWIDGERVNLSAWFDNPPESFLMMWKDFVWGVDSTLGGLFPDRKVVSAEGYYEHLPRDFALYQNYPNPFNPGTFIAYDLPRRSRVKLEIYDILGRNVAVLVDQMENPGRKVIYWDASNLASGMYFYKLTTDQSSFVKKMLFLK